MGSSIVVYGLGGGEVVATVGALAGITVLGRGGCSHWVECVRCITGADRCVTTAAETRISP